MWQYIQPSEDMSLAERCGAGQRSGMKWWMGIAEGNGLLKQKIRQVQYGLMPVFVGQLVSGQNCVSSVS